MKINPLLLLCAVTMLAFSACAQESPADKDTADSAAEQTANGDNVAELSLEQKFSYVMGTNMARQMQSQNVEFDIDQFLEGFNAARSSEPLKYDESQARQISMDFQNQLRQRQIAAREKAASENKANGEAFLAANAKQDGVVTLPSGLQYKVIEEGTGPKPTAEDRVTVHYRGTLVDGTEFDSTYSRNQPATFPLNGVIPGWSEGVQLMAEGSKYEFYIPAKLGYGAGGTGKIGPNSTLIFEVELLKAKAVGSE